MRTQNQNRLTIALLIGLFIFGLLIFGSISMSAAQEREPAEMAQFKSGPQMVILYDPIGGNARVPLPKSFFQVAPQTATINVNYIGVWDQAAQAAFQFAVDIWETQISSSVPIEVKAEWKSLSPGTLAVGGPKKIFRNFPGAPLRYTWYPVPLANALSRFDLDPEAHDINTTYNKDFKDWYFGTDGNTPSDKTDFASIVLHELGHGLGFIGTMSVGPPTCNPNAACWGFGSRAENPSIYDRFIVNGAGRSLVDDFPNNSAQLLEQLTSNNIFFNGPNTNTANGGPAKLWAPGTWASGASISHLDEKFNETPNSLMTFSFGPGKSEHYPGPVILAIFKDMGWGIQTQERQFQGGLVLSIFIQFNVIINGGFESGPGVSWDESSIRGLPLIFEYRPRFPLDPRLPTPPHGGNFAAWLGGIPEENSFIEQQLSVPVVSLEQQGGSQLTYWYLIGSEDDCGFDFGGVKINGTDVVMYDLCELNKTDGWVSNKVDLSPFSGQIVTLQFWATTDNEDNSNLFIDDVAVGP